MAERVLGGPGAARASAAGGKLCRDLRGVLVRSESACSVSFFCWADAAGGSGCTLTISHVFLPQRGVNRSGSTDR